MRRRSFLKASALLTASTGLGKFVSIAGPFTKEDFTWNCAPKDKKLDSAWVRSLFEKTPVTTYRKTKNELRYIGMPVGGICCGTVYVGGDGRLWLWDIFNQNQLGAVTKVLPIKLEVFNVKEINNLFGSLYLEPATTDVTPLQQGMALVIKQGTAKIVKRLHQDDWDEITFEATYPAARIKYTDRKLKLEVTLDAFSPFIPGDAEKSGFPATIQSISLKNRSESPITVEVTGWLENKMLMYTAKKQPHFTRSNKLLENGGCKGVLLDSSSDNADILKAADYGNMTLAVMGTAVTCIPDLAADTSATGAAVKDFIQLSEGAPVAVVSSAHVLKPNQAANADFIISWYTPNSALKIEEGGLNYYVNKFAGSEEVAASIAQQFKSLKQLTLFWKQSWYNSTLPSWFMERTFLNISTLATSTSHRFKSGRFYAWEGVGCCAGTCAHVYQYAHAMSRIFPELERDIRERVDLGLAFDKATGKIGYRGENTGPSIDGQAGTVLRIYREYLMSPDGAILKENWDKIKAATEFVILQDKNRDGMEDTPLENTLDALWSGEISWIVGLCIAAVRAGQKMAEIANDTAFAKVCADYVEKGSRNMEAYLFNGEYFIHRPDPKEGKKGVGSYNTCHIDQVYGQAWAWQVGLGRILSKEKTMSALNALWKYNYMPDVGPYIKQHPGGRFYAVAGDGGMVMNTNPKNDSMPYGEAKAWQIGYFSECMSGFEHQVASHMMAEGMVKESLILTRSIHDRYHAAKRNPFNEIECSDHYGRAMASFGTFISACGFNYNGPEGYIGFAPKLTPENFKAPFTVAEGWGAYSQQQRSKKFNARLKMLHGKLKLKKLSIELDNDHQAGAVRITLGNKQLPCTFTQTGNQCEIVLNDEIIVAQNQVLTVGV